MNLRAACLLLSSTGVPAAWGADRAVAIRFRAQVGDRAFACGQEYEGIGVIKSKIRGRDFRFYVSNVRLLDASGRTTPIDLDQDGKWQLDDLTLLDFEDGTGLCSNGTPEMNSQIAGKVPEGEYTGLRFTLGVPFKMNHTDPLTQPSPLNLTALFRVWNTGHKFARIEFASTGAPRGFFIHLGSTGCTPHETKLTVPVSCKAANRVEVTFPSFDLSRDAVIADLAALVANTNVDTSQNPPSPDGRAGMGVGCMSGPSYADCSGLFRNFGIPFGDGLAGEQKFFRVGKAKPGSAVPAER
jgi:uncharacterized repeat protein (TIGR04052 family)